MERETGLEPVTSSLGSWHSTAELLPLDEVSSIYNKALILQFQSVVSYVHIVHHLPMVRLKMTVCQPENLELFVLASYLLRAEYSTVTPDRKTGGNQGQTGCPRPFSPWRSRFLLGLCESWLVLLA